MNRKQNKIPFWRLWRAEGGAAPASTEQLTTPASAITVALRMLVVMTLLTGLIYPLVVTGIAMTFFTERAQGSLLKIGGKSVGSQLLAQTFTNANYFWPRPSAAEFATLPSGASNKGPTSSDLKKTVQERAQRIRAAHRLPADAPLLPELLLASGSGLDPHLSPGAVCFQIDRVARARRFDAAQTERLRKLVEQRVEPPQFGFLGEPRVNVLVLNRALDELK